MRSQRYTSMAFNVLVLCRKRNFIKYLSSSFLLPQGGWSAEKRGNPRARAAHQEIWPEPEHECQRKRDLMRRRFRYLIASIFHEIRRNVNVRMLHSLIRVRYLCSVVFVLTEEASSCKFNDLHVTNHGWCFISHYDHILLQLF